MKSIGLITTVCLLLPQLALAQDDILTTAASNGSFKTLTSLVVAADLDEALQGSGDFTVFAPTDEAFAQLPGETLESLLKPQNRQQLADILKYHVVGSEISIPKRKPSHPITSATTLLGQDIRFNRNGSDVKVNESNVVARNIRCSNGLIHVIDAVLLPAQEDENSIIGIARQADNLKTLVAAVEAAGLAETLGGEGPFTVFAPTDKAFNRLPSDTLTALLKPENKDQLTEILQNHVVSGNITAREAIKAGRAEALSGNWVRVSILDGRLRINQSEVITNDVEASNGVIHIIDEVLLPDAHPGTSQQTTEDSDEITISATWDKPVVRDGISAKRLVVRCSGGGSVRLTNVQADEIETRISGGGKVFIAGRASSHEAVVYGGADLQSRELVTQRTRIQVNGGGEATVNATESLAVSANAGASVRYVSTEAEIEKNINKYASFEPIANGQTSDH